MTKRESMAYRLIENWAELGQRDSYTGHVAPWEDQPEGLRRRALKDVDAILDELTCIDAGICAEIRGGAMQPIWDGVIGEFVQKYLGIVKRGQYVGNG